MRIGNVVMANEKAKFNEASFANKWMGIVTEVRDSDGFFKAKELFSKSASAKTGKVRGWYNPKKFDVIAKTTEPVLHVVGTDTGKDLGIVGAETPLKDAIGASLKIGDVVTAYKDGKCVGTRVVIGPTASNNSVHIEGKNKGYSYLYLGTIEDGETIHSVTGKVIDE